MILKFSKQSVRRELLLRRGRLSPEIVLENSKKISEYLINLNIYRQSTNIMLYVATKNEVQTKAIIESAQKDSKKVFVPIIVRREKKLLPSLLIDFDKELTIGYMEIPEPRKEFYRIYPPTALDLIIVPGVAFTVQGDRLGMGGGYYDRFLKQINPDTPTVALSFETQILEDIPLEDNDMAVDYIITENRVILTKQYRKKSQQKL